VPNGPAVSQTGRHALAAMHSDQLTPWRVFSAALLVVLIGLPLGIPFWHLLTRPAAWEGWRETSRLLFLAWNTACLAAGTVAVTLPAGTALAILLYRTNTPGRRWWRLLILLLLFIPLPVTASAWQAALGAGGWLALGAWGTVPSGDPDIAATGLAWKPWVHGFTAAIWLHAVAGLPWVVWIVGQGLRSVERELEEDALTVVGPLWVLWRVTLPRCRTALWVAALWLILQVATEITVTDVTQVGTFAEEVYTQIVVGDDLSVLRSVAVAAPSVILLSVLVGLTVRTLQRRIPPLESLADAPVCFHLPLPGRVGLTMIAVATVALLAGVPFASLIWKAGIHGTHESWSGAVAWTYLDRVLHRWGGLIVSRVTLALCTGVLAAGLGLVASWLANRSRWFGVFVIVLAALAWAEPAPIVGLGLKEAINWLMVLFPFRIVAKGLYYGPSLLPVLWAHLIRFFPFAVAILWPAVRRIPTELRDAVRVDGGRPQQELPYLIVPLSLPFIVQATVAIAILSLGELGAEKLVETPDAETIAHVIFTLMHYGVTNDLAALCLFLLGIVLAGSLVLALTWRLLGEFRYRNELNDR
jgi:iron(III) transport system permease protein